MTISPEAPFYWKFLKIGLQSAKDIRKDVLISQILTSSERQIDLLFIFWNILGIPIFLKCNEFKYFFEWGNHFVGSKSHCNLKEPKSAFESNLKSLNDRISTPLTLLFSTSFLSQKSKECIFYFICIKCTFGSFDVTVCVLQKQTLCMESILRIRTILILRKH